MKAWIVWVNDAKQEGVVFTDYMDAMWTATGQKKYRNGIFMPTIGCNFRETFMDDANSKGHFKIEEVELPIKPGREPKGT